MEGFLNGLGTLMAIPFIVVGDTVDGVKAGETPAFIKTELSDGAEVVRDTVAAVKAVPSAIKACVVVETPEPKVVGYTHDQMVMLVEEWGL